MQEELSLREQKRLKTRLRIEDAATLLVDEHGFAAVTVEETVSYTHLTLPTICSV